MKKELSEMSLKELWELFPIILVEHQDCWNDWYKEEETNLYNIFKNKEIKINHIGSTSIKNIMAKPTIDVLIEIPRNIDMNDIKKVLIENNYGFMNESKLRMSFNKGYTIKGFDEKVFHIHIRYNNDNDELYFRDYMNDNPLLAKQYEKLKIKLWKKYEHNRDKYTEEKSEFVIKHTEKAKEIYKNRY